jgi:hypothetical protein
MINLTPKQLEYLPAVQWLVDGSRRSGRTWLIAVALFTTALQSGQWTAIFDHGTDSGEVLKYLRQFTEAAGAKLVIEVRGDRRGDRFRLVKR